MRLKRRSGAIAALAVGATACVVAAGPAGADVATPEYQTIKNPLTTNVPLLAWKGAEVKLVDCSPAYAKEDGDGQEVEFRVQKFSGDVGSSSTTPVQKLGYTEHFFEGTGPHEGEGCVKANFDSVVSGLAVIHMTVTSDEVGQNQNPYGERDFIVGWMKLGTPTLDEVDPGDPTASAGVNSHADTGEGPFGSDDVLGDAAVKDTFNAGANNGRFTSSVKGTIPIRTGFFDDDDLGTSITLPDDWAALANAMATDQDADLDRAAAKQRWDIHDDQLETTGHVLGNAVGGPACDDQQAGRLIDAVENCSTTTSVGFPNGFSRVFAPGQPSTLTGDEQGNPFTGLAIGPFDPLFADGTLLSDGKLDAGDAPMPPARLDFAINDGGIGSLEDASKPDAYSRDGEAGYLTAEAKGNLYAPFYVQTPTLKGRELLLGSEASGIDSSLFASNFPGIGTLPGIADYPSLGSLANYIYPNWAGIPRVQQLPTDNGCNRLRIGDDGDYSQYQRPSGNRAVTVLTDEHGEAQGEFKPGTGFNPEGLSPQPKRNANGGCDLKDIKTLGTAKITATARYPYHDPQDNSAKVSSAITKTVNSLFDKSLSYFPKGEGDDNANARIVIAHGQDIDGSPLTGERVCFSVDYNAESARIFRGNTGQGGKVKVQGQPVDPPKGYNDVTCARLDAYGNAALEVFNSNGTRVNVIAEYYDEGVLRHTDVEFGTPGSSQGPGPLPTPTDPVPVTPGQAAPNAPVSQPLPAGAPGNTAPSGAVAGQVQSGGVQVSAARPRAATEKWTVVGKIIRPIGKKAYLRLKATGPSGQVKVAIRIVNKKGKTVRRSTVSIPANRTVNVRSVKLGGSAKAVRVSVR